MSEYKISTNGCRWSLESVSIDLGEERSGGGKREITFGCDPVVFFGVAFDTVARVTRISVQCWNQMTNFIGTRS